MKDYTKSKRSVLTKGINHMNLQHGKTSDYETDQEVIIKAAAEIPAIELKAVYENPEQVVLETAILHARFEDIPSNAAVYKALDEVESLVSDARSKFTNLFSPGTVTAIVSALDRARSQGWHGQNQVSRVAPGQAFVSGGDAERTPDYSWNPSSPGDGFEVSIGSERYGSTDRSGTGEDVSPSKTTTSSTRYTGLGQRGGQQPDNVTAKPGRSGNYGHGSEVVSTVGPDGKLVVKHRDHPTYKPSRNPAGITVPWFVKLGKNTTSNEDIQDMTLSKPSEYTEEELREGLKVREEELRREARQRGEDETTLKARDPIRNGFQKRLWSRRLLNK